MIAQPGIRVQHYDRQGAATSPNFGNHGESVGSSCADINNRQRIRLFISRQRGKPCHRIRRQSVGVSFQAEALAHLLQDESAGTVVANQNNTIAIQVLQRRANLSRGLWPRSN